MSAAEGIFSENAAAKGRRRNVLSAIFLGVIALHVAAGFVAGAIVVAKYFFPPPATFEVKRDIRLPAKQREHRMNMAAFDAMAPKPTFNDKLQRIHPAALALPELPKLPVDQMMPLDPSEMVADQLASLAGAAGTGASGEAATGTLGTGLSFFGVSSDGQRILLLFDVSTSVVNKANRAGVPLAKIQEETASLISRLPIGARFGIIQFTRNYKPFRRDLVPATDQNRSAAQEWIQNEWIETGMMSASSKVISNPQGLVGVLECAAKMQPDTIFLISDGSFQWTPPADRAAARSESPGNDNIPWKEIENLADGPLQGNSGCKIHFIGFEMKPDDKRNMSRIVRKSGGKLEEVK